MLKGHACRSSDEVTERTAVRGAFTFRKIFRRQTVGERFSWAFFFNDSEAAFEAVVKVLEMDFKIKVPDSFWAD